MKIAELEAKTKTETAAQRQAKAFAWRFDEAERLARLTAGQRHYYADACTLRGRLALEQAVPAWRVLTNRQVLALAEMMPFGVEELACLQGMNRAKIDGFGAELVALARLRAGLSPY